MSSCSEALRWLLPKRLRSDRGGRAWRRGEGAQKFSAAVDALSLPTALALSSSSPRTSAPYPANMSDKVQLQDLSAEQEADRLLEEDDAQRNPNVLSHGLTQLEREENLPPPATSNQTSAVSRNVESPLESREGRSCPAPPRLDQTEPSVAHDPLRLRAWAGTWRLCVPDRVTPAACSATALSEPDPTERPRKLTSSRKSLPGQANPPRSHHCYLDRLELIRYFI